VVSDALSYYSNPGEITQLKKYQDFIDWLTDDPESIAQVVQGLLVHDMWIGQYGETYNQAHAYPQKIAYMEDLLDKSLEIDPSSLALPRHPRNRVIVCCREFATLMCALLRAKKIPARSRCGFATYFGWNGTYEDHWICEYWNGTRWICSDPQLDPFQQSAVISWGLQAAFEQGEKIQQIKQFNPRNLKPGEFISAGYAWKLCREGKADPMKFGNSSPIRPEWGINSLHGLWFVRGQLLRDFAALNKVETVPYLIRIGKGLDWKSWHLISALDKELTRDELLLLDTIAEFAIDADTHHQKIRRTYLEKCDLTVPDEIIRR
jgi:Transglutaminase-like superfamily